MILTCILPGLAIFRMEFDGDNCRTIGPFIKTIAALIDQTADAAITVDIGVLARDGAFLSLVVLRNLLEFLCIF